MPLDLFGNPISHRSVERDISEQEPSYSTTPQVSADAGEVEVEQTHRPPTWIRGTALIVAVILLIQATRIQVLQGTRNHALAQGNSLQLVRLPADRGLIIDSEGNVLAQNTQQVALVLDPQHLPARKADREPVYAALRKVAKLSDATISHIEQVLRLAPDQSVLKANLSTDDTLLYREQLADVPGVGLKEVSIRQYSTLPSMGHILGYVGAATESDVTRGARPTDQVGKSGIEAVYQAELAGVDGIQKATVNAFGEVQEGSAAPNPAPVAGKTIQLSLNSKIQGLLGDALVAAIARRDARFGPQPKLGASAVALDPNTGAILGMASYPNYDANLFSKGISNKDYAELINNPGSPLLNRVTDGLFPSASTIKPLVASAGMQEKIISPDTQVTTPYDIKIGDFSFADWKLHGLTNTRKAIAESNNIFFYAIGGGWKEGGISGLGITRLSDYLGKFGLGKPTGVDLTSEAAGRVPTPEWKQQALGEPWYIGDTYITSIGQGNVLVTPLQMATAISSIVNGGTLFKPQLLWSTANPDGSGKKLIPHQVVRSNFIEPQYLQAVREGMRLSVGVGSASPLQKLTVQVAGKTGTAEFGSSGQLHGWFVGYAPFDKPEIIIATMVEGGGEGYQSALPMFEQIVRGYFNEPLAPGEKLLTEPASSTASTDSRGER